MLDERDVGEMVDVAGEVGDMLAAVVEADSTIWLCMTDMLETWKRCVSAPWTGCWMKMKPSMKVWFQ